LQHLSTHHWQQRYSFLWKFNHWRDRWSNGVQAFQGAFIVALRIARFPVMSKLYTIDYVVLHGYANFRAASSVMYRMSSSLQSAIHATF
jgi:hypothetical protein